MVNTYCRCMGIESWHNVGCVFVVLAFVRISVMLNALEHYSRH